MFLIHRQSEAETRSIQKDEQRYLWSRCVDGILRKHGLIGTRELSDSSRAAPDVSRHFSIITRGRRVDVDLHGAPACFEGPVHPDVAAALGISTAEHTARTLELFDAAMRPLGALRYMRFQIRAIPWAHGQRSLPYEFVAPEGFWNQRTIVFQELAADDAWQPLVFARADGAEALIPVGVSNGRRFVLGAPLFDLIAYAHTYPPLGAGYYAMIDWSATFAIEQWLVRTIVSHAVAAGQRVVQAGDWPGRYRAAFTVRHDYDRPIAPQVANRLVDLYGRLGVKSSWGFFAEGSDDRLARLIASNGHEPVLHSTAWSESDFLREVDVFEQSLGARPAGYTTHGGAGSPGFLGQHQYEWSERAGLLYGEMLGRAHRLPHRVNQVKDGIPQVGRLTVPVTHASLDISMKPEDHALDYLLGELPLQLAAGGHVVLMNHPDLHLRELEEVIGRLDLSNVWCATLADVCDWCDSAKLGSRVLEDDDSVAIEFPRPLLLPTSFRVLSTRGEIELTCKAGERTLRLDAPASLPA